MKRLALLIAVGGALALPVAAAAHPLGNFTVNHYAGIELAGDRVYVRYVLDLAEIPTFQFGNDVRAAGFATTVARSLELRLDGRRVVLRPMAHRVVVRSGPRVERLDAASLDAALDLIEERARALARTRSKPVELRFRTFEPVQHVAHRLELRAERGLRAGVDVRGDGSVEAWTGRLRRQVVAQEPGESAYAALRRTLQP